MIQIAFLFQAATVWPSWESVYRECLRDARISVRLFLISDTTVETAHGINAEEFLVNNSIEFERIEDIDLDTYNPDVVFIQFPYDAAFHVPELLSLQFVRKGVRVVYVPYGIEIADTPIGRRDHFCSRVVENAWRIYTSSKGIYDEYQKYCRNRKAVRITGSPKFDCVFNQSDYRLKKEYIEKANGRKIIVWKMHFPKKNVIDGEIRMITPELSEYLSFVDHIKDYKDLFFIILPHPKLVGKLVGSDIHGDEMLVEQSRKLINRLQQIDNAVVDTDVDYRGSLFNADAIIADRSAVMVEAAMLDVPVLILHNANYSEPMVQPVKELVSSCSEGVNCGAIMDFVEQVRDNTFFDLKKRHSVIQKNFPYLDGKCGQRIVEDIISGIKEEVVPSIPRVILYGTGEVSAYYMDKQGWANPKNFELMAVADSDERKHGREFFGHQIISPNEIIKLEYDYIVVMTEPYFYDIQNYLVNELCIFEDEILRIDEFIVDVLS